MTVKEIIKKQEKGCIYEFRWINMEKIYTSHLSMVSDYPAQFIEELSDTKYKVYKVLVSKDAQLHAKLVRKIKSCLSCLRYSYCEDLTKELRDEHDKALRNM